MKDKVAIVTGAGCGIGFEIAKQFAAQGANVILNDIDHRLASAAADSIGGACFPVAGDAADPDIIQAMVETALTKFGRINIAVANAGITRFGDFFDYSAEALHQVLNTNIAGSFLLTQRCARQMREQKDGGCILLMSSVTAHTAHKNLAAYAMTKAALEMLAKNLVMELSPFNIRVNTIAPGATATERTNEDPDYNKVWSAITPLGRPASPADIANAAVFLASDAARHITGQSLVIDGGWSAVSPSPF